MNTVLVCMICDKHEDLYRDSDSPKSFHRGGICTECKKRLKDLLYENTKSDPKEIKGIMTYHD